MAEEELNQLERRIQGNVFRHGNCAQTSFDILQEHFGLEDGKIFKALTTLPGIGLRGETCGAVIGSLMALGLVYGRGKQDEYSKFLVAASLAQDFCRRFENELGSTNCGDILDSHMGRQFNFADPKGMDEFRAANGTTVCSGVVRSAVLIAAQLMLEHPTEV